MSSGKGSTSDDETSGDYSGNKGGKVCNLLSAAWYLDLAAFIATHRSQIFLSAPSRYL